MVKKKGGRDINPADAHRKAERAKEIARNKKERQLQRAALKQRDDPETLRRQLKEVIDLEQAGKMNPSLRLQKKALQQAYDLAIKRSMEEEAAVHVGGRGHNELAPELMGLPEHSVYFHPTLNPMGIPPPGKPQKHKIACIMPVSSGSTSLSLPVPKQPPLPAGLPPPLVSHQQPHGNVPLVPTTGPPPGMAPLPPPPGPPPATAPLPPPPGLLPAAAGLELLPPPGPLPWAAAGKPLPPPVVLLSRAAGGAIASADAGQHPLQPSLVPFCGAWSAPPRPLCGVMSQPADVRLLPLNPTTVPPPDQPPMLPISSSLKGLEAQQEHEQRKAAQRAIISGRSTVVPLPRAHEDKRVTALVPASVRVRREQAPAWVASKPAPSSSGFGLVPRQFQQQQQQRLAPATSSAPASVDDKVSAFLESLAGL